MRDVPFNYYLIVLANVYGYKCYIEQSHTGLNLTKVNDYINVEQCVKSGEDNLEFVTKNLDFIERATSRSEKTVKLK